MTALRIYVSFVPFVGFASSFISVRNVSPTSERYLKKKKKKEFMCQKVLCSKGYIKSNGQNTR